MLPAVNREKMAEASAVKQHGVEVYMTSTWSKLAKGSIPLVLAAAFAVSAAPTKALADARVGFGVTIITPSAPPSPRYERVPNVPRAYRHHRERVAWVPGHWEWRGHKYRWVSGYYAEIPRGKSWRQARWDRDGDRWARRSHARV